MSLWNDISILGVFALLVCQEGPRGGIGFSTPNQPLGLSPLRTGIYCGGLESVCVVVRVRAVCA